MSICEQLLTIEEKLADDLLKLDFITNSPIEYIYNPLDYARQPHQKYLQLYANKAPKTVLFLGMNPGPFGMAQTGIPFGHVGMSRDFLKVSGFVGKPDQEHPKRPVDGFNCKRNEVSGERLWSFFRDICKTPENFAKNCLVHNHCPLVFMSKSGKNVTPPEMGLELRTKMFKLCDAALCEVISLFECQIVVGLGRFAESRAKKVVRENSLKNVEVKFLVHPSPASPAANSGWANLAFKTLDQFGIIDLLVPEEKTFIELL